ncbi:MAG: MFS transporter [Rubrobacter sp.]|nr:MFS transporter [Rubrobacter sp.]
MGQRGGEEREEGTGGNKRGSLMSGPVVLLVLATFATFLGFQLLLSVVPLYAAASGGGSSGAGLATAAFMLSTVLTQVTMPRLLGRFGYRRVLVAGLLSLGLPASLYSFAGGMSGILAVTLARGIGFGIVTVVFVALVVELTPPERRGEALGLFGVAITLPTIFCNPLGLWLVDTSGYTLVFLLGGLSPLLALFAVASIHTDSFSRTDEGEASFLQGLRRGPLLRLFLIFAAATSAAGVMVTFLPLALPDAGLYSPAAALLVFGLASTLSRLWAGRFGDRKDPHLLLAPGLLASALGTAALPQGGPTTLGGALLFGVGLGLLQNSTFMLTMNRVADDERGLGSTLWNVSFDAGTGAGALFFGFLVGVSGFAPAFYLSAVVLLLALVLVAVDSRHHKRPVLNQPPDH